MNPERILLIQLRRIGDVLFTLPVIRALRENLPHARIDFLVERPADQLVRLNPHIGETLVYDKARPLFWLREIRRRRYDWVLDFHANGRTLLLTLCSGARLRAGFAGPLTRRLAYTHRIQPEGGTYIVEQKLGVLRSLGLNVGAWSWDLRVPAEEKRWADGFLHDSGVDGGQRRLVGFAPASRRETRRWRPARFAQTAAALLRRGRDVLILWGPGEKELVEDIVRQARTDGSAQDLGGRIVIPPAASLLRLAALIARCDVLLSVENGPKNLAVALGIPTVNIVGPNNARSFNPSGDASHVVVRDEALSCLGCELNRCPTRHECLDNITVDRVLGEIEQLLAAPAGRIPLQPAQGA